MPRKNKFYVGQIVRRKVRNTPIGPYMQVMHITRDFVYADIIGHDEPNVMLLKKDCYTYTITTLFISEELFFRLKIGSTVCAQHTATIRWQQVFENPPELITFQTQTKGYRATYVVENIFKQMLLREPIIRIIVNNRIL